jgi:hypothetical protein
LLFLPPWLLGQHGKQRAAVQLTSLSLPKTPLSKKARFASPRRRPWSNEAMAKSLDDGVE